MMRDSDDKWQYCDESEQRAYLRERFMYRAGYGDDLAEENYKEEDGDDEEC